MKLFKKAGMFDLIIAMVLMLITAVCLVIFTFAQNTIETELLAKAPIIQQGFDNSTNVTQIIIDTVGHTTTAYTSFKWISVLLIFGLFLSILISSFVVRAHPVWFVGYIFIVVISIILSVYISNSYEILMNNPTLASTFLTGFFAQNWIFLNLPVWITLVGLLGGLLMYVNLDVGGTRYV